MMIICQLLRKNGILAKSITVEHYHDLGKWMFATTAFWSYIAFSQYMLIWYANLPEETIWYKVRWENGWEVLSYLLIVGHFFFPFLVLLARGSKRNLGLMFGMAFWVLFIEYIDLYFVIMPNFYKSPAPHWLDFFGWLAEMIRVVEVEVGQASDPCRPLRHLHDSRLLAITGPLEVTSGGEGVEASGKARLVHW